MDLAKVLVLDAEQRSALAVTRSLGSKDGITVFTSDSSPRALAGCSVYSHDYIRCPSRDEDPRDFLDWIEDTINTYDIGVVFPVTEITSQLLLMHKSRLGNCKLPFPDYESVMALADKGKLMKSAQSAGVPVPQHRLFSKAGEVDSSEFETFPLVIKPCMSRIWTGDDWLRTTVHIVKSQEELRETLKSVPYLQQHSFMIQSFIPGHGAGIFALYNSGKPVAYFSHRRLREKPPGGGVSVLCESIPVDPKLRAYADSLLSAVHWHGVAMVEFRVNEDGTPYLMEVNTRFWGSLQLSVDAGLDFPYLLWMIATGRPLPQEPEYHIGQRLRWFLGDLDSLYLVWKSRDYPFSGKLQRLKEFCFPTFRTCRHEINRRDDLRPALFELQCYVKNLLRL